MNWVTADVFLGVPVKVFAVPAIDLRRLQQEPLGYLHPDAPHFEGQCLVVLHALEKAGHLPRVAGLRGWAAASIIGLHRPACQDVIEFTVTHPAFPRVEDGYTFPREEVRLFSPEPVEEIAP